MVALGSISLDAFHKEQASSSASSAPASSFDTDLFKKTLQEKFLEWTEMPPEERVRNKYLKDHNLTENKLADLPPEERAAHEDKIAEEMKKLFLRPDTEELPENKLTSNAPLSLTTMLELVSGAAQGERTAGEGTEEA